MQRKTKMTSPKPFGEGEIQNDNTMSPVRIRKTDVPKSPVGKPDPLYTLIQKHFPEADAEKISAISRKITFVLMVAILVVFLTLGVVWIFHFLLAAFQTFSVISIIAIVAALAMIGYGVAGHWRRNT